MLIKIATLIGLAGTLGAALDNLVSDDITSTVSNFVESNDIPGNGSASLQVIVTTDSLGNIALFSITDATNQVVTNTLDTGQEGRRMGRGRR